MSSHRKRASEANMDNHNAEVRLDCLEGNHVNISGFSDEILLNILAHVPSHDLVLSVGRVCKKMRLLSLDKSLTHHISLSKEYQASDDAVKQVLRELSAGVHSLSMSGCYWLSGSTLDQLPRCRALHRLDVTGCRLTTLRLSRILSALKQLRSLAMDVCSGFDCAQLSGDAKAALSRLTELKQTLCTPSYGVVPCCTNLERLLLHFEISELTRDGGIVCCQLMVGQSSIPHYQNLQVFYARLAPGEVNQTLMNLYLAVFSVRVPDHLHVFVLSVPGSSPGYCPAAGNLLEGLSRMGGLEALQVPRAWANGPALPRILQRSHPTHLNLSRCPGAGDTLDCLRDPARLLSLNLSGTTAARTLLRRCANLRHLNLSGVHYHHPGGETCQDEEHLCSVLAGLRDLRSLALPVCALSDGPPTPPQTPPPPPSLLQGLKKSGRVCLNARPSQPGQAMRLLLRDVPFLQELELIGCSFSSAAPRYEPANRREQPACGWAGLVGDPEVAALGKLAHLHRLTLAQLPGVVTGCGLLDVATRCRDLQVLSLANLGPLKNNVCYMAALVEALPYCQQLRDFRLEQPYISANARFFQALSRCASLQRLCVVSRNGSFQADAVPDCVQSCRQLVVCHMFMGGSLVACKSLQKLLQDSLAAQRPALSVVIFPLLHEDLALVIREMPLLHLDEFTLFKSHVAEDPPHLWW